MEELKRLKKQYLELSVLKRALIIFGTTLFGSITAPIGTVLLLVELWNVIDQREHSDKK